MKTSRVAFGLMSGVGLLMACYSAMQLVFAPTWLPNFKGIRIRDKFWKHFISVNKVLNQFDRLLINV